MENYRNAVQKVAKMKELGIFDKWVSNTDKQVTEFKLNCVQRRNRLLSKYAYLSDMIEASFIFLYCPGRDRKESNC
jgi:N12 class adenine-specific DNA methylase